jgi:phosphate:Na+ symporter
MGQISNENLILALESLFELNEDKANKVFENEKVIDYLNDKISSMLVKINNMTLSNPDAKKAGKMLKIISNIERIGDHAENIAENTINVLNNKLKLSDAALAELKILGDLTIKITDKALEVYKKMDVDQIHVVDSLENEIDDLAVKFPENHIERLKTKKCEIEGGVIFTDTIIDLERIADHAKSIAFSIVSKRRRKFIIKLKKAISSFT